MCDSCAIVLFLKPGRIDLLASKLGLILDEGQMLLLEKIIFDCKPTVDSPICMTFCIKMQNLTRLIVK